MCNRLCLYQKRSSKVKVRRTLLTNHFKIILWDIYKSYIKKRTPSIILVTASQFFQLSKLIGICWLNFTVGEIWISKVVFFCLTYNANLLELNLFLELMKAEIKSEMVWNGKTCEIFLKLSYLRNLFVFFAALLKINVIFLDDLKMQ